MHKCRRRAEGGDEAHAHGPRARGSSRARDGRVLRHAGARSSRPRTSPSRTRARLVVHPVGEEQMVAVVEKAIMNSGLGLEPGDRGHRHSRAAAADDRGAPQGARESRAPFGGERARRDPRGAPRCAQRRQGPAEGKNDHRGRGAHGEGRDAEADRSRTSPKSTRFSKTRKPRSWSSEPSRVRRRPGSPSPLQASTMVANPAQSRSRSSPPRVTSPSSWTATAVGRDAVRCRAKPAIRPASSRCARRWKFARSAACQISRCSRSRARTGGGPSTRCAALMSLFVDALEREVDGARRERNPRAGSSAICDSLNPTLRRATEAAEAAHARQYAAWISSSPSRTAAGGTSCKRHASSRRGRRGRLDPEAIDEAKFAAALTDRGLSERRSLDQDRRREADQQLLALGHRVRRGLLLRRALAGLHGRGAEQGVRVLCTPPAALRPNRGADRGRGLLATRIITGAVLGGVLICGLFFRPRSAAAVLGVLWVARRVGMGGPRAARPAPRGSRTPRSCAVCMLLALLSPERRRARAVRRR